MSTDDVFLWQESIGVGHEKTVACMEYFCLVLSVVFLLLIALFDSGRWID